jgi:hypothetical protein
MSMLTPRGMRGQYKITGKIYPRMTRRRRKWPIAVACLVALAVLSTGAWAVYHFTKDDSPSNTAAGCPAPSGSASATAAPASPAAQQAPLTELPAPSAITVNVYNATQRQGLAKAVSEELKKRGFTIGKVTNDPLKQQIPGPGQLRTGVPGKGPGAVLAAQFPGAQTVEDTRTDATVDLVLGETFQSLAAPEAAAAALAPPPPPQAAAAPARC